MNPHHLHHSPFTMHLLAPCQAQLSNVMKFIRILVLRLHTPMCKAAAATAAEAQLDEAPELSAGGGAADDDDNDWWARGGNDDDDDGDDDDDDDDDDDGGGPAPSPEAVTARAALRRRLAGAVSYECGERLGQRLLQVSLLGVRMRYQRLGVGTRLFKTLLSGEASNDRPDAAIAWADTRALCFFKRHGFTEDPILNSRYREISAPWARSTLMSTRARVPALRCMLHPRKAAMSLRGVRSRGDGRGCDVA